MQPVIKADSETLSRAEWRQNMIDWNEILEQLADMRRYFVSCKSNARKDTAAYRKFTEYIVTLNTAMELIRTMVETEDDGK